MGLTTYLEVIIKGSYYTTYGGIIKGPYYISGYNKGVLLYMGYNKWVLLYYLWGYNKGPYYIMYI